MTKHGATAAGLVVAAMVALAALRPAEPTNTPAAPHPAPPAAATSTAPARSATEARVEPAAPAAPTAPADRELRLPDGTSVPTLNGASDAEPLATYWGPFPWSPIVGVERNDQGLDWYRHADGSYSTTQMVWRQDLGRMAAMTRVAHPGAAPAPTARR